MNKTTFYIDTKFSKSDMAASQIDWNFSSHQLQHWRSLLMLKNCMQNVSASFGDT